MRDWGGHGEVAGEASGGEDFDRRPHPQDTTRRDSTRHSLAWTRTLHFLQETRMLVPSSSRYGVHRLMSVLQPVEVKHISGINGLVLCFWGAKSEALPQF